MRDYRKINAWQEADDLTVEVYQKTQSFPKEELYGLTSQIRRAAYSMPSNIAEGSARGTNKDYLHFLHIARASLTEVQYFIHLSGRLGYLPEAEKLVIEAQIKSVFVRLHGLIQAVSKETGIFGKGMALFTSSMVIGLSRLAQHVGA